MAEFKISRIRYRWRGTWNTSTEYNRDDIIRYGGSTWVCIRQHTASAFQADQDYKPNPQYTDSLPAWEKMADGKIFRGLWATSTLYDPGDLVSYGGNVWLCVNSHTSGVFDNNIEDWAIYAELLNFVGDWAPSTRYGIGDIVRYGGRVLRCIKGHTSTTSGTEAGNNDSNDDSTLETWEVYFNGEEFKGPWTGGSTYRVNDRVLKNGSIYKCTQTNSLDVFSETAWSIELPGQSSELNWNSTTVYAQGSVVRYGGYLYYALIINDGHPPGTSYINDDSSKYWELIQEGINFRDVWTSSAAYKTGDVVRRGGNLYIAVSDSDNDQSSMDYMEANHWDLLVPAVNWRRSWAIGTSYAIGDIVTYLGTLYKANTSHFSDSSNFPGDNGSGYAYWDVVLLAADGVGLAGPGEILTYDLSRTLAGDNSTYGPTGQPLGTFDYRLTVDANDSLDYKKIETQIIRRLFVSPVGQDTDLDIDQGVDPLKPYRTIRYAAEIAEIAIDNGFTGHYVIQVNAGSYEEILPIVIPARTAIIGGTASNYNSTTSSDLRTTTVKPNKERTNKGPETGALQATMIRLGAIIPNILSGLEIVKSPGNTETQDLSVTTTLSIINEISNLVIAIEDYIEYYINGFGTPPTVSGANSARTATNVIDAITNLENNKEFLIAELAAYINTVYFSLNLSDEFIRSSMKRVIDSIIYDTLYSGNYKTVRAAQYFTNYLSGSSTQDMFYLRDATGIKSMTLVGLEGELGPPSINQYRIPTGGSFCSLDPGWGPDHEAVWINTRSPYLQGCTTFGTGCIGQKIDGSLHNGGNRSFVSNDYTQVIDNGIGAWVLNKGRAELISIFTYYCHVGYLAEAGGTIRSANGNNSYGSFGSVSNGNDPAEIPLYGTVNNRTQQAIVASVFSGEANDEVIALEWTNAGSRYTTASYEIVGAGTGIDLIQEDFRDNAVTTVIVDDGGGGFTQVGNNAQAGNLTTITIASNDTNEAAQLLGLRILIISGTGSGQYGYIGAYDSGTKVANIYKETNDQPGWDHVAPGKALAPILDTTTRYRIEPRVIFDEPAFLIGQKTLPTPQSLSSVAYGETSATFTNIEGTGGTGTVVEDDGLTPAPAIWNIVRTGRSYTVTLVSGGAGYAEGDIVTITGDTLDGATPDNDIRINVKQISNDSTNSILDFDYQGVGRSGVFFATYSSGNAVVYSPNGDDWYESTMPSNGNWKCLAGGNGILVAIRYGSNVAASSYDGETWTTRTMPASRQWESVVYADGVFVAISSSSNSAAYSTNGITWTLSAIPGAEDSSFNEWCDITYGEGKFVAIARSNNAIAQGTWNGTTLTWVTNISTLTSDSSQLDWVGIAFGNNRFVALTSTGQTAYSRDLIDWQYGTMITQDGSTQMNWKKIRHGQGVFVAICDTGFKNIGGDATLGKTQFFASSENGVDWFERTAVTELIWDNLCFGTPDATTEDSVYTNNLGKWVMVSSDNQVYLNSFVLGARAKGRAMVEAGKIVAIRLWDVGSGYTSVPEITIDDPNATSSPIFIVRLDDGVLGQPSIVNRGTGYRTSSTRANITGDGYADVIPVGKFVYIDNLERLPGVGAQFRFGGRSKVYTVQVIEREQTNIDGTSLGKFRVTPNLKIADFLEHGFEVEIRQKYSQCRITGHDFLDVGTGTFLETNYPELYSGKYFSAPENEVYEINGGRVFYTSTDQSGNFRTGELFAVEQATGVVTISADYFDFGGLSELRLGGIRFGSGVVIREFSTDALFTADSNNVVPTQRAIRAYLQNRLSIGGSDVATPSFVAGQVLVGPQRITTTTNSTIDFPQVMDFRGGINGQMLAEIFFKRSFN